MRSCRYAYPVMRLPRIVAVIGSFVFDDKRTFITTIVVTADEFPWLIRLSDKAWFTVEAGKIVLKPYAPYLAVSVSVAAAIAAVKQIGSLSGIIVYENMAVYGLTVYIEPRTV